MDGGRGMGRGMGMGGGMGVAPLTGPAAAGFPSPPAGGSEIDVLKVEAQNLEAQLEAINARIAQTGSGSDRRGDLVAVVNAEKCTGCGLCEEVCSPGAITIDTIAAIDVATCTGCGQCVAECPQEALMLKRA
jgi:ferredoxin